MLEADNERTILDYLNEDCWRVVLRYVPVQDIIRSETVSRQWQRMVLLYLEGIRFSFQSLEERSRASPTRVCGFTLPDSRYESFERWTTKLGSRVAATYCMNEDNLKTVRENCPNLEFLTCFKFNKTKSEADKNHPHDSNEDFKKLKRLCFDTCHNISDHFVSQTISDNALEAFEFYVDSCGIVTGQWLISANLSKMKTLIFDSCCGLQASHLVSSVNQLTELTRLELISVPVEIAEEIQLVLDKMPKLEWLEIHSNATFTDQCYLKNYEPICRLSHLRNLSIDLKVTDVAVAAITECCTKLVRLVLWSCVALNSQGLKFICQNAGARLTELGLYFYRVLTDNDLAHCVRWCPKLTHLTLGWLCTNCGTSPALPDRMSAARHEVRPGNVLCVILIESRIGDNIDEEYERVKQDYEDLDINLKFVKCYVNGFS